MMDATAPLSGPLSAADAQLRRFLQASRFTVDGGVVTDLDGTAVLEDQGRVVIAEPVVAGLKALVDQGRPVVLNTLRFPLNVVRTFGKAWSQFTSAPLPLVSLNGAVLGLLDPMSAGHSDFEPLAATVLPAEATAEALERIERLLGEGVSHILLFHYSADWRAGETIWTASPAHVAAAQAKYPSASRVVASSLEGLQAWLAKHPPCMLSLLADIPEDRRMAYQHADPSRFFSPPGVDKLSGAKAAAAQLGFALDQSVGAGDTPMDRFLAGVGLAFHVGPIALTDRGLMETVRLPGPRELGAALLALARLQAEARP